MARVGRHHRVIASLETHLKRLRSTADPGVLSPDRAPEGRLCSEGFQSIENYRLCVLLHAGGIGWPKRPTFRRCDPARWSDAYN